MRQKQVRKLKKTFWQLVKQNNVSEKQHTSFWKRLKKGYHKRNDPKNQKIDKDAILKQKIGHKIQLEKRGIKKAPCPGTSEYVYAKKKARHNRYIKRLRKQNAGMVTS